LKTPCVAFSDDTILITPFYTHRFRLGHRDEIDKFELDAEAVISFCREQSANGQGSNSEYTGKGKGKGRMLKINVTLWGFNSQVLISNSSFKAGELDKTLDDWSLSDGTMKALQSTFTAIKDNVHIEVLDGVLKTLETFAKAHPITSIVAKALLIPYKMWKGECEFKDNLNTLARDMCTSLKSMASAYPAMDLKSSKDSATSLLKLIVDASKYVESFANSEEVSISYPK